MNVSVVIGSNYGDEGKGIITDHLSQKHGVVVRFNGGAQAGHTVVDPDGRRHVFHHFGSGTFRGAATFLGRRFISNPILFLIEQEELRNKLPYLPLVYVDKRSIVTTPWDMILNQEVEKLRGVGRHGSCGVGINETVTRNEHWPLTVGDLKLDHVTLQLTLRSIQEKWLPYRAAMLGVAVPDYAKDPRMVTKFLTDCEKFMQSVETHTPIWLMKSYGESIVFEGAQGLRLSEDSVEFPHVTRSFTGLKNVQEFLAEVEEYGLEYSFNADVHYVTRPYITRHGNGPLLNQFEADPNNFVDKTNVTNEWQGTIRYGWAELFQMTYFITRDARYLPSNGSFKIALTHLDELDWVWWFEGDRRHEGTPMEFALRISKFLDMPVGAVSRGPTRNDITR